VAGTAGAPEVLVGTAVDREVEAVVLTEHGYLPTRGRVAGRAVEVELSRLVIGVGHCQVLVAMAIDAFARRVLVAAGVTAQAIEWGVSAGERIELIVTEGGALPAIGRVAEGAIAGQTSRLVIRVDRRGVVVLVTIDTVRRRPGIAGGVAGVAVHARMGTGELVVGSVVEGGTQPAVSGVTEEAVGGEACGAVVRIAGRPVVVPVAADTVPRGV